MKGIVPIREKFLQPNFLGALQVQEGFIFFRVIERRICRYKPYNVIDSNGNPVVLEPLGYNGEFTFPDPRNTKNEVLFLSTSKDERGRPWILHGAIGVKPSYVNVYLKIPSGKEVPGKFPNLDPIRPSAGDNLGYLCEEFSPYGEPTDYIELVIPPRFKIGAEYYNKSMDTVAEPVLDLYFAVYSMQILDPRKDKELVKAIAMRKIPAAFLTAITGGIVVSLGSTTYSEWGVEPVGLEEVIE